MSIADLDKEILELELRVNELKAAKDDVKGDLDTVDTQKMTKEEVISVAMESLPELTDSLWALLEDQGVRTGSSVLTDIFNPHDIDICVCAPPHVFSGYAIGMTDLGYWEADGFTTLYARRGNRLINIICFSDYDLFESWEFTTEIMKFLAAQDGFGDRARDMFDLYRDRVNVKWCRVRLFRALRDIFYPVKTKYEPFSIEEAHQYYKCRQCGREAINFTCASARNYWRETGICERCSGETY